MIRGLSIFGGDWETYRSHCRGEDQRRTNPRHHRLAQHELIILIGETGHHQPKDMQDRSDRNGHTRTIAVEQLARHGGSEKHEEN
jgi:hypothetical protein